MITVGGPPSAARNVRRYLALIARVGDYQRTSDVRAGHRYSLAAALEARTRSREVIAYQLPDGWRVAVYDGGGRLVETLAAEPLDERAAAAVWWAERTRLRQVAVADPITWVLR